MCLQFKDISVYFYLKYRTAKGQKDDVFRSHQTRRRSGAQRQTRVKAQRTWFNLKLKGCSFCFVGFEEALGK